MSTRFVSWRFATGCSAKYFPLIILLAVALHAGFTHAAIFRVKDGRKRHAERSRLASGEEDCRRGPERGCGRRSDVVAAGTYFERVTIKDGVALCGGFAGTETTLDQRDWTKNFSLLNVRTNGVVVSVTSTGPTTRVDGMVITGGSGIFGGRISSAGSWTRRSSRYVVSSLPP